MYKFLEYRMKEYDESCRLLHHFIESYGINEDSIKTSGYTMTGRRKYNDDDDTGSVQLGKFIISINDDKTKFNLFVLEDGEEGSIDNDEFFRYFKFKLHLTADPW